MDYELDDWQMVLATFALIICMLWDFGLEVAKNYLKVKIPPWIPTNFFVLSALTIQILSYVQIQKDSVFGPSHEQALERLVQKQLKIDAARLTMCVFVGCLLPEMAMAGTQGRWSNVAALFVSLSFHIATEIYALQNANDSGHVEREAGPWFISSGVLLLVGALSLILLLGAVMLAGKLSRDRVRWNPPQILPGDDVENEEDAWETFRRRVIESWIRSRTWKTWYFVSSSEYSAGAGMIVTFCVAVMTAKVVCRSSLLRQNNGGGNLTFFLQCVFIILGWMLMLYRWFKAGLYCSKSIKKMDFIKDSDDQRRYFSVPAAVVVNLIFPRLAYFVLNPRLKDFLLNQSLRLRLRKYLISLSCLVPLLPFFVLILAISLLWSICFICRYLSVLALSSQFVQHLCKLDKKSVLSNDEYSKYKSILDVMGFKEEDSQHIFWKVNRRSYDIIMSRMDDCKQKQSCTGLLSIMGNSKLPQNQRFQYLENSWMKTIATIFRAIADVKVGVDMENAFAAYRETVNVLKFVDYPENIVVDPLNTFSTLNFYAFANNISGEGEMGEVERSLKKGLGTEKRPRIEWELTTEEQARVESVLTPEERERVDEMLRNFSRILKPSDETASNSLLMRLEECCYYNVEELGELLRTLVGHVIVSGLLEAPHVILKWTKRWAHNAEEKKIDRAIELAGMVIALLENVVDDRDIISLLENGQSGGHIMQKKRRSIEPLTLQEW
ncbi:hypothetical protein SUGI_0212020 [Cryptomeria japonica]|nr:hypothetical protein SUGI_0212020 [Cryptomeria japonica]